MTNAQSETPPVRGLQVFFLLLILAGVSLLGIGLLQTRVVPPESAVPIVSETPLLTPSVTPVYPPVISIPSDSILSVPEKMEDIAFSPDGSLLAAMGEKTIYLWTMGEEITASHKDFTPADGTFETGRLAISPDNKILYRGTLDKTTSPEGRILRWDIATGDELLPRWEATEDYGPHGTAIRLDLDLKNNTLNYFYAVGYVQCPATNFFFYRWDLDTGRLMGAEPKHIGSEFLVQAAAGGGYQAYHYADEVCSNIYSGSHQRTAVFNGKTKVATLSSSGAYGLENMTFSLDGHYFVGTTTEFGYNQMHVFVLMWQDFERVAKLELTDEIRQVAISADSRYAYLLRPHRTSNPGRFRMQFDVIDLDARQWIATLDTDIELNHAYPQLRFALSPDGKHLAYVFEQQAFFVPVPDWESFDTSSNLAMTIEESDRPDKDHQD